MKKKIIQSSALALRFYEKNGWTIKELLEIAPKGGPVMPHPKDSEPYFVYRSGENVDTKILIEHCSKLIRRFDDYPYESDEAFMRKLL